ARTASCGTIRRPAGYHGRWKTFVDHCERIDAIRGSTPMKLRDMSELAVRNLREAILRNSLTTLGVGVGIASLVAMLSLGVGLQELATKRLTRSGLFDSVFVAPRTNIRGFGRAFREGPEKPEEPRALDEDARQQITRLANVIE